MRYIVAVPILVLVAAIFSSMLVAGESLATEDAYLDFLDKPTVAKVMDYRAVTFLPRVFTFTGLFAFWAIVGMATQELARRTFARSTRGQIPA